MRRTRRPNSPLLLLRALLASALLLPAAAPLRADSAAPSPERSAPPEPRWDLFGSWRGRQEFWDWFGDTAGAGRYTFTGSLLRFGAARRSRSDEFLIELAQPLLLNLPDDASLPPPAGQLGHGAAYRDANGGREASLFLKQAYWRRRDLFGAANSLQLGRFEFADGQETAPKDPSLAWLKRERISQRLIGNFGFTHVQRSLDGGILVRNTPELNLTLLGAMPTAGVFDLDGGVTLDPVHLGYAAASAPFSGRRGAGDARLFALYSDDLRDGVVKTDNRPLPVRTADRSAIRIGTVGGHAAAVWHSPAGEVDGLVWVAMQFGDWGSQEHGAFAVALEAGFQPRGLPGAPWLRGGFQHYSGDGNPGNDRHGTFFPVLPSPRLYARFPFFTTQNLNDGFVQAIVRPHRKWTLRSDVHFLSLAEREDLWYAGGGAFQHAPAFGYGGRPAGGARSLATLFDLSADYRAGSETTLTGYVGYTVPGDAVRATFPGGHGGLFLYLEASRRW